MALNPNIILSATTPKIDDPIDQYSKGLQLKGLLTQQKAQESALADEAATRDAYKTNNGDPNAVLKSLMASGNYKAAQALQKQIMETEKGQADIGSTKATTAKTLDATKVSQIAQHRDALSNVNSPEAALAWAKTGFENGLFPGGEAQYQAGVQAIQQAARDPMLFNQWKQQAALGATKYIEQNKPTYQTSNLGNRSVTTALPGLGGAPTVVNSQAIGQSPDSVASTAVSRENSIRADNRARETNQLGKVPAGYRMNPDGSMTAIPGGPADIKAGAAASAKVGDAKDVLGLLDEVDKILPGATGSYGGRGVDEAARVFGISTKGAESSAKLKALQGALVAKQPKMSGPQSDKDVALYREMAGQIGDDTLPIETRQAAAATVRQLNEKYAGMEPGESSKTFNTLPDPASLSGKRIQGPDGKIMRSNGKSWVQER